MARLTTRHALSPIAAAALLAASPSWAQTEPASPRQLGTVSVTGRSALPASVGGWGDAPLATTPLQASVFSAERMKDGIEMGELLNHMV